MLCAAEGECACIGSPGLRLLLGQCTNACGGDVFSLFEQMSTGASFYHACAQQVRTEVWATEYSIHRPKKAF